MKKLIELLNEYISSGLIQPEDFYAIRLHGELYLQGERSAEKIKKYERNFNCKLDKDGSGYNHGHYRTEDGIKIEIILT